MCPVYVFAIKYHAVQSALPNARSLNNMSPIHAYRLFLSHGGFIISYSLLRMVAFLHSEAFPYGTRIEKSLGDILVLLQSWNTDTLRNCSNTA